VFPEVVGGAYNSVEDDLVPLRLTAIRSVIKQELDKLVSFSGTPTLAWRRTGEICLVGPEFCMLTGWEKEELLGRKKYVYEVSFNSISYTCRSFDE
jgi:hypothetical protein